jgi:hypothetical protein
MQIHTIIGVALTLACARATLKPASSNSKGKMPKKIGW